VGGALLGIVRGRQPIERVAGAAAVVGIVALPFIPFSADFGGGIFVFIVRYLVPEFLVGIALLSLALADTATALRRGVVAVLAVLVVLDVTSPYIEGAPHWPPGQTTTGVLTGLAIVGIAAFALWARSGSAARRRASVLACAPLVTVLCLAGGWFVQRHYLDHRYVAARLPHDRVNEMFRDVRDARVAVTGRLHFYPMFGIDLSNDVSRRDGPTRGSDEERCRGWRRALQGFDYIVVGEDPLAFDVPRADWIASDPAVAAVLRDGDETVYRVRGGLDPDGDGCA
jgi:hypothetical protein